jgi:hypothetical protein
MSTPQSLLYEAKFGTEVPIQEYVFALHGWQQCNERSHRSGLLLIKTDYFFSLALNPRLGRAHRRRTVEKVTTRSF